MTHGLDTAGGAVPRREPQRGWRPPSGWPGGHRLQQPSLSAHWDMGHKQSVTCMASSPTEQGPPCMGGLGHGSCHAAKLS